MRLSQPAVRRLWASLLALSLFCLTAPPSWAQEEPAQEEVTPGDPAAPGSTLYLPNLSTGSRAADAGDAAEPVPPAQSDAEVLPEEGAGSHSGAVAVEEGLDDSDGTDEAEEMRAEMEILAANLSGIRSEGSEIFGREADGFPDPDIVSSDVYDVATGDFNGDGYADLVTGTSRGSSYSDGAIIVIYGAIDGLRGQGSQHFDPYTIGFESDVELADFGRALAVADFNDDNYMDVAVGAPSSGVGNEDPAGAVVILYGSSSGITVQGRQILTQNTPGLDGVAESYNSFGSAVTAGDFDGDGYADLAIGVPGETVDGIARAGAVNILYGSASGLVPLQINFLHQDVEAIDAFLNAFDLFGSAVAAGDFDGDGYDDLAIGVPSELVGNVGGVGGIAGAGEVNILYGSANGLTVSGIQFFNQDTAGMAAYSEEDDLFGSAVAAGDFDGDGYDDLAIGVPRKDVGSQNNAGAVNILYGSANRLTVQGNHSFSQATAGVAGTAEQFENFGHDLATGNFNGDPYADLVVGVPYERNGEWGIGGVQISYGSASGIAFANNQIFTKDTEGVAGTAQELDQLGTSVATGDFNGDGHDDVSVGEETTAFNPVPEGVLILYAYAQAQVQVLPAQLPTFVAVAGQRNPDAKTFQLSNGTGSRSMVWDAQIDVPWITLAYSHSTNVPLLVQVNVDTTGLAPGPDPHIGRITIAGRKASDTPATVTVRLLLSDGGEPLLDTGPTFFQFSAIRGSAMSPTRTLVIRNLGPDLLDWTASVTTGNAWLELVGATSGTANDAGTRAELRLKNVATLPPGTHVGEITVTSPNALGGPQIIHVVLEVVPPPVLTVNSRQRIFNVLYENGDPPPQMIAVANTGGGGTLAWTATATELNGRGWLHIDKAQGTTNGQIPVRVDTTNLILGQTYRGKITITSPGAQDSPKVVDITLRYGTNLRMQLTPGSLGFYVVKNEAAPAAQNLGIARSAGTLRTFTWQASSNQPWLKIDKTDGDAAAAVTLGVSVVPDDLPVGRYQGQINFQGEVAQGLPSTIPVEFVVADKELAPSCQLLDQTLIDRATAKLKLENIRATPNPDGSCNITANLLIDLPQNRAIRVEVQGTIDAQNRLDAALTGSVTVDIAGVELVLKNIKLNNSGLVADANWKLADLSSAQPGAGKVHINRNGLTFAGSQGFTFQPAVKMEVQGFSATIAKATLGVDSRADTYTLKLEGTVAIGVQKGPGANAGVAITLNQRGIHQTKVSNFSLTGLAGLDLGIGGAEVTTRGLLAARATLKVPKEWGGGTVTVTGVRVTKDGKLTIGGGNFKLPNIKAGDGFSLSSLEGSFSTDSRGRYIIAADGRFALPVGEGKGACTLEVGVTLRTGSSGASSLEFASVEPAATDGLLLNRIALGVWDCSIPASIPIGNTGFHLTGVRGSVTLNSGVETVNVQVQVRTALEVDEIAAIAAVGSATIETRPPSLELTAVVHNLGLKTSDTRVFISKKDGFSATFTYDYMVFHASFDVNAWKRGGKTYITGSGVAAIVLRAGTFGRECLDLGFKKYCASLPPSDLWGPEAHAEFGTFSSGDFGFKGSIGWYSFRTGFYIDGYGNISVGNVDHIQLATRAQIQAVQAIYAARARGETVTAAAELESLAAFAPNGDLLLAVPVSESVMVADAEVPYTVTTRSDYIFAIAQPLTGTLTLALIDPAGRTIIPSHLLDGIVYEQNRTGEQVQMTYVVPMAMPGQWQMRIGGDTEHSEYVPLVMRNTPPPILSAVSMATTANAHQVNVNWRVQSSAAQAQVNIYANPGPLTQTLTITQPDGTVTTEVVDRFVGVPLLTEQNTTLNGSNNRKLVDYSSLPTGVYHLWLEVDDGRNAPVRRQITTVTVNHSNSFPAGAVVATGEVAGGVVAASWETPLTALEALDNGDLLLQWTLNPHPDVDTYRVRIRSLDPLAPTLEVVEEIVVGDVSETVVSNIAPGQTHWIAIGAEDVETNRVAWSQETEVTPSQPDFTLDLAPGVMTASGVAPDALLTGEEDAIPMVAGTQMSVPLQLQLPENFPDAVVLHVDYAQLSGGIDVTFGEDLVVASGIVEVGVAVAQAHVSGFYAVPIVATSGSVQHTLTLVVKVEAVAVEPPPPGSPATYLPLINN